MKVVKVLGSGCQNCLRTADVLKQAADDLDIPITLEKVTDVAAIMGYGVLSTPGVVVDEVVVHVGSVPSPTQAKAILTEA